MATTWKKHHATSGSTSLQAHANGCKLTVIPKNWTSPQGPAVWSATCGSGASLKHKRGDAKTAAGAKTAAKRAAATLKR